jgi:hypothetical protein
MGVLPMKATVYSAITRPRISGEAVSWIVVLHITAKKRLAAPVSSSRTKATGRLGAVAVSIISVPKSAQAMTSRRGVGRARAATTRPPNTEPPAMNDVIKPNTSGPPWKVNFVNIGSVTENS